MNLADRLDPPRQPLATAVDTPAGWTEALGFGSGALCVWLVARRYLADRPIGTAVREDPVGCWHSAAPLPGKR